MDENKGSMLNYYFTEKMSIHTHRMSKQQKGSTSDLEPRRRQQKTQVLGRSKDQAVGEEALQPHDLKSNWAIFVLAKGRGTGIQVIRSKGLFSILLKCPLFLPLKMTNVHLFPLICPLNPLKRP